MDPIPTGSLEDTSKASKEEDLGQDLKERTVVIMSADKHMNEGGLTVSTLFCVPELRKLRNPKASIEPIT